MELWLSFLPNTRARNIRIAQGISVFIATLGGYRHGSPGPRCILGILLTFAHQCMLQCSQRQRTVALGLVYTIGPYAAREPREDTNTAVHFHW